MPLPTVCDGDCAVDVCLYGDGAARSRTNRLSLRQWFVSRLRALCEDHRWLKVFDLAAAPAWQDARLRALADARGSDIPPPAELALVVEPTEVDMETLDAIAWATRCTPRGRSDNELRHIASLLETEELSSWKAKFASREKSPIKVRRPTCKRYKSYLVAKTVPAAKDFIKEKRKLNGRKCPPGFVTAFLNNRNTSSDKNSKDDAGVHL